MQDYKTKLENHDVKSEMKDLTASQELKISTKIAKFESTIQPSKYTNQHLNHYNNRKPSQNLKLNNITKN